MDKNRQQSSDFYRLITETVRTYLGKSTNEFQTSLRLERLYEGIQARKSLLGCISHDTCPRELNVIIKNPDRFCYYVQKRVLQRNLCVQ